MSVILVYMLYMLLLDYMETRMTISQSAQNMQSKSLYDKKSRSSKVKVKSKTQKNKTINRRRKWLIGCRACRSSVHMDCKTIVHTVLIDSLQIAARIYKILRKKSHKAERKKKGGKEKTRLKERNSDLSYRESYGVSAETRWKKGDMAVGKKSETPISNKSICKISRCNSNSD